MSIFMPAVVATSPAQGILMFVVFFGVGLLLFIIGFRTYRRYRLMEDTPLAPIRSIPMGLVHVHGTADDDERLASPLTHTPCFYYKVEIEKWTKREKDEGWETVRTDSVERHFYLDDGTGKVRIEPKGADFDVPQTFRGEVGGNLFSRPYVEPSLGVAPPTVQELHAYLTAGSQQAAAALAAVTIPGLKTAANLLGKAIAAEQKLSNAGITLSGDGVSIGFGNQRYRFTEHCLIAGREHNILGTCAPNPAPPDEHTRNMIVKGQNERVFIITSKSEKQIEQSLRRKAAILVVLGAVIMIATVAFALHAKGML